MHNDYDESCFRMPKHTVSQFQMEAELFMDECIVLDEEAKSFMDECVSLDVGSPVLGKEALKSFKQYSFLK